MIADRMQAYEDAVRAKTPCQEFDAMRLEFRLKTKAHRIKKTAGIDLGMTKADSPVWCPACKPLGINEGAGTVAERAGKRKAATRESKDIDGHA